MAATIIFAGGGSGGHIYPALAIAEQVRAIAAAEALPQPRLVFVCSTRPLDSAILKSANVSFVTNPARPMLASVKGLAAFATAWPSAVRSAGRLLRDAGRIGDVHVCATGGFVAAPVVRAATRAGVDVTMVNLDAVPGKANRWIAPRADRVFTAARLAPEHRSGAGTKWMPVPPIVRRQAANTRDRSACRSALGLDPARPVLVVTTGSQGLRSINEFLAAFARAEIGRSALREGRWQVLHQTGRNLEDTPKAAYRDAGIDAEVVDFTDRMGEWWGAADAAVATAGAGTVAEVWCNRVPALLLPYPHHRDEHQRHNAAPLEECGGAILGTDRIHGAANLETNGAALRTLLSDAQKRAAMRAALDQLGPADGAERIARALLAKCVSLLGEVPRTLAAAR